MLEYATSKVKLWPACLCPSSPADRHHLAAAITADLSARLLSVQRSSTSTGQAPAHLTTWMQPCQKCWGQITDSGWPYPKGYTQVYVKPLPYAQCCSNTSATLFFLYYTVTNCCKFTVDSVLLQLVYLIPNDFMINFFIIVYMLHILCFVLG